MLNKTNTLEINKSIEKWIKTILSNKHRIEQLKRKKSILSIQDHVNQMSEVNETIEQIFKRNKLKITDDQMNPKIFLCLRSYVNRILKETGQIEQILKNTPDTTNALETDTSFKEFTLEQVKQIIEETKQIEQILNKENNESIKIPQNYLP